ncbi:MAG TPA: 50S ribosomal protein L18 [Verrucomicrobiae bacterium]|nr:50S ribosomal protein L18 [Verrucomicrobiae bacterium]
MSQITKKAARQRLHRRIRKKVAGTAERPRLSVHFSGRHIHAQIIDDAVGKTLAAVSTTQEGSESLRANVASATEIGRRMARQAIEKNIRRVVFDRGGFTFHGKVKALADAAREAGLEF